MQVVAALYSFLRYLLPTRLLKFTLLMFLSCINFWSNLIQFLGRDKDDGARRSAVSGKKVTFYALDIL